MVDKSVLSYKLPIYANNSCYTGRATEQFPTENTENQQDDSEDNESLLETRKPAQRTPKTPKPTIRTEGLDRLVQVDELMKADGWDQNTEGSKEQTQNEDNA